MVAVSEDGGRSFAEPVNVIGDYFEAEGVRARALAAVDQPLESDLAESDDPANFGGVNAKVALGDAGTLYVLWIAVAADLEASPPVAHFLSRSTDRGKTFTVTEVNPFDGNVADNFEAQLAWSPAGGPLGSLHIVYEGTGEAPISGVHDIYYRRSTDEGGTWTETRHPQRRRSERLLRQRHPRRQRGPERVDSTLSAGTLGPPPTAVGTTCTT